MSGTIGKYAQIPNGSTEVENTIVMPSDFTIDGYTFISIPSGVACEPGAYYNSSDGLFYADSEFSNLSGTVNEDDGE